jgi:cell wall-associated NlpC family hydrolase
MATPAVEDMLGAWDATSPQQLDTGQIETAIPEIGPHTNESIIKPLMQQIGGYEKGVDGWRKAVVEIAQRYVGDPYVWGGTQPGGFDCSGLIQYVYGQVGKHLPRISYQQANYGHRVSLNKLQPGDLVAWDNSSRNNGADHIAIYIGHGRIIEAPRPGLSVRIRSLGRNEGAWGVSLG